MVCVWVCVRVCVYVGGVCVGGWGVRDKNRNIEKRQKRNMFFKKINKKKKDKEKRQKRKEAPKVQKVQKV